MGLIQRFVEATDGFPSPVLYRKWAGLAVVSSLLSRRVWTDTIGGSPLYGNLFIVLVGGPATGKSVSIERARSVLKPYDTSVALGPNSITPEAFIRRLAQTFIDPEWKQETHANSYAILVGEIGTFLKEPNVPFMQGLADLWANQSPDWTNDTKTKGTDYIYDPYVTLLAGAQPGWFAKVITRDVLRMGLPSRIHFVYSKEKPQIELFQRRNLEKQLANFSPELLPLREAKGYWPFTPAAQRLLKHWQSSGQPRDNQSLKEWPKILEDYCARRLEHAGRLALVVAASNHPGHGSIEESDLAEALSMLFEAEIDLPAVMDMISGNPFRAQEREVLSYVYQHFHSASPPLWVPEAMVRKKMNEQIPSNVINIILQELLHGGLLMTDPREPMPPPKRRFGPGPNYSD